MSEFPLLCTLETIKILYNIFDECWIICHFSTSMPYATAIFPYIFIYRITREYNVMKPPVKYFIIDQLRRA